MILSLPLCVSPCALFHIRINFEKNIDVCGAFFNRRSTAHREALTDAGHERNRKWQTPLPRLSLEPAILVSERS